MGGDRQHDGNADALECFNPRPRMGGDVSGK